ncbi:MAG: hypothetical protein H2076_02490, partial [Planctomycetes bacterium]|nr:hypothetical protein [Planctomycetota bacterium]
MTIHISVLLLIAPWIGLNPSGEPTYVGSQTCMGCHQQEHSSWLTSHHAKAMLTPDEKGAVASFKGQEVKAAGLISRFIEIAGVPHVEVEDSSGKIQKPVKYFFGIEPCQQVLIEEEPGKLQSYPIAWSTGSGAKPEGWYPLFPGEKTPPGDPLHWTGSLNNWNHMCAECHSTGVSKNYDASTQQFKTRYEEIDVACEACHGPGSHHLDWAQSVRGLSKEDDQPPPPPNFGFSFSLSSGKRQWVRAEGEKVATRNPELPHSLEQETCARCHSRRTALVDGSIPGKALSQTHQLSLLEEGLYHADGQILDEVYVHGSFLQSRMHQKGVTCTDCHDPHSGELYLQGNALCIGCHEPARYDSLSHTHHTAGT